MRRAIVFIIIVLCLGMMACKETSASEELWMGMPGCEEETMVGIEPEIISEETVAAEDENVSVTDGTESEVDESEEIEAGRYDEDEVGEYIISEEEMRHLVDANYNCVSNIFEVRLDGNRTATTGDRIPVTDDDFATYAELETYIRSIYVGEEANYLLYRYSDGLPTYWEADGVFYMRDELCGGGPCFGCPWESYTIEEYAVDGIQCAFTVLVKYPEDIAPENVKEERYYFTATYADGWKLDSMVCKGGEGATGHSRENDTVSIDEQKLISEKDALDIAYNFYYGDSDIKEYSVYCEELPYLMKEDAPYLKILLGRSYAGTAKTGYVIYQVADENGMAQEKYDPDNPSPEKDKWILYSLGSTENRAYYVFWLYQYVSDGDGAYHLTTGDYCIVSYDGSVVVSERKDSMGNEIADTMEYNDLEVYLNY